MKYLAVAGISKPVARIAQGTAMITGVDPAQDFALLDSISNLGGTTFDTALNYGAGRNERAFGNWLSQRRNRDDPGAPIGPILETLNEHLNAGRVHVHAFGAGSSN